jgi:cytochrome b6-f complex iron-sulfur subunit
MSDSSNVTGAPPAAAPPAAPPPKPPLPAKPAAPAKTPSKGKERRFFLLALFASWIAIAWTALTVSVIGMVLGTVRFLFPNVLSEPPSKVTVGFPGDFPDDKVTDDFKDKNIWVVKHGGIIYALSTTCTHLGCTPNWLAEAQKFKCPCHGSGFKITGVNFEGPAPRPLERWGVSLDENGKIVVDKSKKFQKEMGQWDNPESYLKV